MFFGKDETSLRDIFAPNFDPLDTSCGRHVLGKFGPIAIQDFQFIKLFIFISLE